MRCSSGARRCCRRIRCLCASSSPGGTRRRSRAAGERYGRELERELLALLGEEGAQDLLLLVPSPAPIRKKQGAYRYQVLVKLLRTKRTAAAIRLIYAFAAAHRSELFAQLEVNPQDMF